jgi:hypothetical protein
VYSYNKLPDQAVLERLLRYEDGKLYWRPRSQGGVAGSYKGGVERWNKMCAGKEVGWVERAGGYRAVELHNQIFKVHRLVWKLLTGQDPVDEIDHINGDVSDNRIENLREATRHGNARNAPLRKDSALGLKGVQVLPSGRFRSAIQKGGKKQGLGTYDTPEEAYAAYCKAATELFGEFANHGNTGKQIKEKRAECKQ